MKEFRDIGIMPESEGGFGRKEIMHFANAMDRELRKLLKIQQCEQSGGME
jgi:hypothetical protein